MASEDIRRRGSLGELTLADVKCRRIIGLWFWELMGPFAWHHGDLYHTLTGRGNRCAAPKIRLLRLQNAGL